MIPDQYETDILLFAARFVWFTQPEKALADKDSFLAHVMARGSEKTFHHACEHFGYTKEDFIQALHAAQPGDFLYEKTWLFWNDFLGISPPLPFPMKYGPPLYDYQGVLP
jgi:hypothetical protein